MPRKSHPNGPRLPRIRWVAGGDAVCGARAYQAIRASAHAQHAISRAVAQLATQGRFPDRRIASRLSCSLLFPLVECRLTAGATDWPLASAFGALLDMGTCHAASTRAALAWAFPAFVMPPRDTVSPLECSEGVSPHHDAKDGAVVNVNLSFADFTNEPHPFAPTHMRRSRQRHAPLPVSRSGARSLVR